MKKTKQQQERDGNGFIPKKNVEKMKKILLVVIK
jgi:hypothetical protein